MALVHLVRLDIIVVIVAELIACYRVSIRAPTDPRVRPANPALLSRFGDLHPYSLILLPIAGDASFLSHLNPLHLNVSGNLLYGELPTFNGARAEELDFSHNHFQYEIPYAWKTELVNLTLLDLSANHLNGQLYESAVWG